MWETKCFFATICSLSRSAVHYYKVADHLLDTNKELKKVLEPTVVALVIYKRVYYYSFAYYYVGLCMRTDAKYKEALDAFTEAKYMAQAGSKDLEKAPMSEPYKKYGMKHALEDLIAQISKYLDAISSACTGMKPTTPDALIDMPSEKRKVVLDTYSKVGKDLPKIANTELGAVFRGLIREDLPADASATYAKLVEYLDELIATEKGHRTTVTERNLALARTAPQYARQRQIKRSRNASSLCTISSQIISHIRWSISRRQLSWLTIQRRQRFFFSS